MEIKSMKKQSFKTQFKFYTGLILFLFCLGGSILVYTYQKKELEHSVYKETEIYIAAVEAIRAYVKDVLRPKMYDIIPEDHFIPEAMSTSFVGREVMRRVEDRFAEFNYKRAAINPRNPINKADSFEHRMINWFRKNNAIEWSGVIKKGGRAFYARLYCIRAEKSCLRCHGDPKDAPTELVKIYGKNAGGYGYKVGDVVATDAVYIPVELAVQRIKKRTWATFFVGGGALLILIILFYFLFNKTVISELEGLLLTFRNILEGEENNGMKNGEISSADEIGQLKVAFEQVAHDLKNAHEKLKESETRYRRLFEASQDAIFIWDMNKKIIDLNEAGIKMFGLKDKKEAISIETIDQLFWDARDSETLLEIIKKNGSVKEYEVSMVDRYGKRKDVLITANLKVDKDGKPEGFEGIMRDVTEKKKFERYIAQTERLASIGQLAAGVAHEINNPLGVIQCYSNLIKKSINNDSQICSDLEIIEKHTKNCKRIVKALLDFARVSETRKRKVDIHMDLEEVVSVLEKQLEKENIVIKRSYDTSMPPVLLDSHKMKQVYMNLIMNARQAITDGGEINIATKWNRINDKIIITFKDSGTGISDDILDRIFDPFFTTKGPGRGTGLGLSVSYGIVKEHGGEIQVESRVGKGSIFTIILPIKQEKAHYN